MIGKIFMPPGGNTLKKIYLWTTIAGMAYAGSSFIMTMVTSNLLGAYATGLLGIAMPIGNQLITLGCYNMRAFQVSDVMEKHTFSDYCVSRILTVGAMLVAGGIWMVAGGYSKGELAAIVLMILFKAGEAVSDLMEGRYQQKERYDVACRGVFYKVTISLVCFIVTMAVTKDLIAALVALTVSYLVLIFVIDSRLIKYFGGVHLQFRGKKQMELLLACLPLFINSFLTTYVINAAKYTMNAYYSKEFLGMFTVLYMMAFVINLFASFGLKPMISTLSMKYAQSDRAGFIKIMQQQSLLVLAITVVCIAGAYVIGTPVLSLLFGFDLSAYRLALCVMLLGGGFTALFQLLQYGIVIMRHQYSSLIGCVVAALFTFFVTPLLTKKYAINGAAISYLCSMAMMSAVFFIFIVYYLRKERREFGDE